jgi:hypothetical protein
VCIYTNASKAPFGKRARRRAIVSGYRTHVDIKGPLLPDKDGNIYEIIFTDDKSRHKINYHLKHLKNLDQIVSEYISTAFQYGHDCKIFRYDQQFNTKAMTKLFQTKRIRTEASPAYCQSSDGVAEIGMKVWQKTVRAIIKDQNRKKMQWSHASNLLIKTLNCLYTSAAPDASPLEQWTGETPDVSFLRVPLCDAFFFKYKDELKGTGSFEDKRTAGMLIDYCVDERSYRILTLDGKVYDRRHADVTFDERCKLKFSSKLRKPAIVNTKISIPDNSESSDDGLSESEDDETENNGDESQCILSGTEKTDSGVNTNIETQKQQISEIIDESNDDQESEINVNINTDDDEKISFPVKLFKITKLTTKWTSARIAKHFQIPLDLLAEYNGDTSGNIYITKSTKFTVGTTLNIPIIELSSKDLPSKETEDIDCNAQGSFAKPKAKVVPRNLFSESKPATYSCFIQTKKGGKFLSVKSKFDQDLSEFAVKDCFDDPDNIIQGNDIKFKHQRKCSETMFFGDKGEYAFNLQLSSILTPKNYRAAHENNPHSELWTKSEDREMETLKDKYEDVCLADVKKAGHHIGHGLFQYRVKIDKLKSRLCYDGSRQDPNSYGEIAASVLRYTTARLLMIKGVHYGHHIRTSDVESAFLQRKAPKPFYMYYPKGRGQKGRCMKWTYMLYGRKDSPIEWLRDCQEFFEAIGFVQSEVDPSLFTLKGDTPADDLDVGIFVDDFIYQGSSKKMKWLEQKLIKRWPVKLLGDIDGQTYLGMDIKIDYTKKILKINQKHAIQKFLKNIDMLNCKTRSTPMDSNVKLFKIKGPCEDKELQQEYRTIVGSLMHFAIVSRPDIAFPAVELSRLQSHPIALYLKCAKQVVKYLKSTMDKSLVYDCGPKLFSSLVSAADANWAERDDATSTSGNCVFIGGCVFSWLCASQHCIAHSSCESEYISLDSMGRELEYLCMLFKSMRLSIYRPITILEDNQSAIAMTAGLIRLHKRSKHIALRYHYIRQLVQDGLIKVRYQPTAQQPADLFTKQLGRLLFHRHTDICMGNCPSFKMGMQPSQEYPDGT